MKGEIEMPKKREFWDGNISEAREKDKYKLSEEYIEGNREYENGTYGQSEYTVRPRSDGTSDVYIKSDSADGHCHYHIDSDGNILDYYHEFISKLNDAEQEMLKSLSIEDLTSLVSEFLKCDENSKPKVKQMKLR